MPIPNWAEYQGDPGRNQYRHFDQINTDNIQELQVLWEYQSGGASPEGRSQMQCNPLVINGVLYGTSPILALFAVDARTGEEIWKFDPSKWGEINPGLGFNRGISYWEKGTEKRLLYTAGHNLFAINPETGQPIKSFGADGVVNLKLNLDKDIGEAYLGNNTPGAIFKDLIIIGGRTSEGADHAPGHIRAFNVITGEREWIFHTIPFPGEFGYDSWPDSAFLKSGGANSWSGISMDPEEEIVYVPTGSASFDFFGGDRPGANLFANCIIALNANTGERIWHYQLRHHDLWDRDLPAPPNLITIQKDGKSVKALAQITKSGHLFVLNRLTGEPIHPIDEVKVPASKLAEESAYPTQPLPTVYPQFSRGNLTEADLATRNEDARNFALAAWEAGDYGEFVPPSLDPQILFPGMDGGGEWGGAAFDPDQSILYVNSNEMTWKLQLNPYEPLSLGQSIYQANCQSCHAEDFKGNQMFGNVPSLIGVQGRKTPEDMAAIIQKGKGVMPAFAVLTDRERNAVIKYISNEPEDLEAAIEEERKWPYPYFFAGYQKYLAPDGFPIITPPWGQLTAVDMNAAKILWQVPFGNIDSLDIDGHPVTGIENYGGPVITSGGLLFIAATADEKFRVFDKMTGELLYEKKLPAAGYATPATYMADGKQYVVVACGGGKMGTKSGDTYVAFGLP